MLCGIPQLALYFSRASRAECIPPSKAEILHCQIMNRTLGAVICLIIFLTPGLSMNIDSSSNEILMSTERAALGAELWRDRQLTDQRVIEAIEQIPRHLFVPDSIRHRSYDNCALPIGKGQTISQPFVVAYMTQELRLKSTDRVLEIGTGSGYHAAVLSRIAGEVFSIEIIPELGNAAANLLKRLDYSNIHVRIGDGYQGWKEEAPFDAVILTAAPDVIPQPLIDQLAPGGRLIAPVGERIQQLVLLEKDIHGKIATRTLLSVVFVPMTGEAEDKQEIR